MEQLAMNGGKKAVDWELKARFIVGKEEKAAADQLFDATIESGRTFGYSGPEEEAFGKEFATFLGAGYADGVNSGSNAVFVSLCALDLPPFSEVIVSPVTDPGGIMPIVMLNCIPVVADSAPHCYNTSAEEIAKCITPRTRAIIVAHIGGEAADIEAIAEVAKKHGLALIEDCAQSHGTKVNNRCVGTFGDYGAFSLMFGKHICAGGQGGAVVCGTEENYWRERRAADRGKPLNMPGHSNLIPAINCNMDELHATIARAQLRKLPMIIDNRRRFVEMLKARGMDKLDSIIIPELIPGSTHTYWWWRLRFREETMKCTKLEFCAALQAEGVLLNPEYGLALPFTQEWFQNREHKHPWNNPLYTGTVKPVSCPNTMQAIHENFNLTVFESWGEAEADAVMHAFRKVTDFFRK